MRLEVDRYCIKIIPENVQDEVYIEEVLGLKTELNVCEVRRVNAMGFSSLAYLRIQKP